MKTKIPEPVERDGMANHILDYDILDDLLCEIFEEIVLFCKEQRVSPDCVFLPMTTKIPYEAIKRLNELRWDGTIGGCVSYFYPGDKILVGSKWKGRPERAETAIQKAERNIKDIKTPISINP